MEGTPFGRYRLIELLGRGGMGEVWRAHDTDTDRIVAIKVLPVNFSENEDFKQRFRREAHAAARLNTPHVVPIHHYGEIDGRLYVDMRLIEGRDLQTVLADGPLPPGRAVRIIEGIALALHAAHKVGLLHRDVKPSNILLDEDDFAYLIDFGIARAADETRLTKSGNMIGTFAYIAPERLGTRAEEDARADIYSLACVLYECLTGSPPFASDTMAGLVAAHLNTPPPNPSTAQPEVPEPFDEVIATGMAKDPDQRYATTVELATAAHDAITVPIPRPAVAPTTPPRPRTAPTVTDDAPPAPTVPKEPAARTPVATPPGAADRKSSAPEMTKPALSTDPSVAATQQADWTNQPPTHLAPAGPVSPPVTPKAIRGRRLSQRAKIAIIIGAVAVVAVAVTIVAVSSNLSTHPSTSARTSSPSTLLTAPTEPRQPTWSQVVLPFANLRLPSNVAVDTAGNVYATVENDVLELTAGAATSSTAPVTGLSGPYGVAVDSSGNLYITEWLNNRVLKVPRGQTNSTTLPFSGLSTPMGVAVDNAGDVFIADEYNGRVLKLAAGAGAQTVLPFTDLGNPRYVAAGPDGSVYVSDENNWRVLKLAPGATTPIVLPFGRISPQGVAVDNADNVYISTSGNQVLKLANGASTPTVLPFTGLNEPIGVAVSTAGDVYVANYAANQVLKLSAQ